MKKTIVLRSEIIRDSAANLIKAISIDDLHEIVIRPHKKNRSLDQNALLWKWMTIIGDELGYTKDEMHRQYKGMFLVPIMLAHPDDYPDFCGLVAVIQDLRDSGSKVAADDLARKAVCLVSTTKIKVKHMTEYLSDIDKHAVGLGIKIPAMEN